MKPGDDTITILRARGRRLAKKILCDRIEDYDLTKVVDLFERPVTGLADLTRLLDHLASRPDIAVVRGAIADPTRTRGVRRMVHADPETGDLPTLVDRPRRWLALDIDRLDRPEDTDPADLVACGALAAAKLPDAFHRVSAVVQATASHGIKPGLRLRLWYWLSRPVSRIELQYWLRKTPVDFAVLRPAQLIYTAFPIFTSGTPDPLDRRIAEIEHEGYFVSVPSPAALTPPPRRPPATPPPLSDVQANHFAFTALSSAASRVARAPQGQRHPTLVRQAFYLSDLIRRGLLKEGDVRDVLTGAARTAGLDFDGRDAAAEAQATLSWALSQRNV